MNIITTKKIEFNTDEREKINKIIPIMKEIVESIDCSCRDCSTCLFGLFCNQNTADEIEREINNYINEE